MHGAGGSLEVAGGEEVEQGSAQDGEDGGPLDLCRLGAASVEGLRGGKQFKPVLDGRARELRPCAVGVDERTGVGLGPQRQQRPVLCGGKPTPHLTRNGGEILAVVTKPVEELELLDAGPGKQGPEQSVLALEQEEQDTRTRADGGERAQRQVRQTVLENLVVRALEQLVASRRGCWRPGAHPPLRVRILELSTWAQELIGAGEIPASAPHDPGRGAEAV